MAEYEATDTETGRTVTFEWNGDTDPTENDMTEVFAAAKDTPHGATRTWEDERPLSKRIGEGIEHIGQDVLGLAEVPAAFATGATSYAVSKAAGLGEYLTGGGRERAEQAEREWGEKIQPYQPITPGGKWATEALAKIPEAFAGFGKEATRLVGESWGVPKEAMYLPEMAGEVGGMAAIPKTLRTAKAALADNIFTEVGKAVPGIAKATVDAFWPKPTPEQALGQVLQGKSADLSLDYIKGKKALAAIDTSDVRTYADLDTKIVEKIPEVAKQVDAELMKDPTIYSLDDLATVKKTKGGAEITSNYVKTAIDNLEELYLKVEDPVKAGNIGELRTKAETEGLTKKEVNDLARTYGSEYKSFNKKTGEPLTSVSAETYENVRTGLKEVVRRGLDETARELDSTMSALYNTKRLIEKNVEAANRLRQKIDERGLGEKVGRAVLTAMDIATFGTVKGAVLKLLPRGLGYKTKNFIDLEDSLVRNLKIINDEFKRIEKTKPISFGPTGPAEGPPILPEDVIPPRPNLSGPLTAPETAAAGTIVPRPPEIPPETPPFRPGTEPPPAEIVQPGANVGDTVFTGKVFHGGDISVDAPFKGLGVHATEDISTAKAMSESGKVQSFDLNNAKLLKIRDFGGRHDNALFTVQEFVKDGVLPEEWLNGLPERLVGDQAGWETRNLAELSRVKDYLKSKGYDGLIYENISEKSNKPSIVMFDRPGATSGGKQPVVAYHGTNEKFSIGDIKTTDDSIVPDRLIGAHFSTDPAVASSFAKQEGGNVHKIVLDIKNPRELPQEINPNGTMKSDQWSFQVDMARMVFPKRKDLFVDYWSKQRAMSKDEVSRIYDKIVKGEPINWENNLTSKPIETFEHIANNYGMLIFDKKQSAEFISEYKKALKDAGYDGIKYKNTSPTEMAGAKDDTTYIPLSNSQIRPYSPSVPKSPELKGAEAGAKETVQPEKVVEPTKTEAKEVTTPKEQKVYVLEKTDDLISEARERWKQENDYNGKGTLTDKEIDENLTGKGTWSTNEAPADAKTVVIDVPGDGTFKVPNDLKSLLSFRRNVKSRMSTSTTPSRGMVPTNVSNKPTGKSTDLITKEAQSEVDRFYYDREDAKRNYNYTKDTSIPEADAAYTKWSALEDDVDSGKRTLKSLAPEFNGRVPSGNDLYAKVREAREEISKQDKYLKDYETGIRLNYPSLAKEMFPETGSMTFREAQALFRKKP